jgi:hypothetical protein
MSQLDYSFFKEPIPLTDLFFYLLFVWQIFSCFSTDKVSTFAEKNYGGVSREKN